MQSTKLDFYDAAEKKVAPLRQWGDSAYRELLRFEDNDHRYERRIIIVLGCMIASFAILPFLLFLAH